MCYVTKCYKSKVGNSISLLRTRYVTRLQGPPIYLISNVTKKRYKALQTHVCVKFGVLQTSL